MKNRKLVECLGDTLSTSSKKRFGVVTGDRVSLQLQEGFLRNRLESLDGVATIVLQEAGAILLVHGNEFVDGHLKL